VIQDFPGKPDFDPAFIAAGARTYLFFSSGYSARTEVGRNSFNVYSRYSDDSGQTWSEPSLIHKSRYSSRSNGILLSNGELLLPLSKIGLTGASVVKSANQGRTWRKLGDVVTPLGQSGEPSVVELKSGRLMMIVRTLDGFLWRAFSIDKGETWTDPERTAMVAGNVSHNLFRMRDGRILLTGNATPPPIRTPLTMRISSDEGTSWSAPLVIAEHTGPADPGVTSRQVSYPSIAELRDGTLVVVWHRILLAKDERWGDIECATIRAAAGRVSPAVRDGGAGVR
jgi:alpha-L-rhamnosidase